VVRARLAPFRAPVRDAVRLGSLAALRPVADHLPRRHALALASVAGAVDASRVLDEAGVRREMRTAFGLEGGAAVAAARARAARRYADFVVNRRILSGREDPTSWRVEEQGTEAVADLRRSGDSFVIATGHFARHASYPLWTGRTLPHRIVGVSLPAHDASHGTSLASRWGSTHLALQLEVWGRVRNVEFMMVDDQLVAANLVARLKAPGTAVVISADAPLVPGNRTVHRRAFAGRLKQEFALGTAAIARVAGCPIVVCVPYIEPDGTVVLEWTGPFAAAGDQEEGDILVLDRVLDVLERMIGRLPAQYVLPIGHDRSWNARAERWEALGEPASAAAGRGPPARRGPSDVGR
jgi:lauroyl/myristoyl acyltransferase